MPRKNTPTSLRRSLKSDIVVAWIALLITLAHAGINAVFYWRGPEVSLQPRSVVLYVQEGPRGSALSVAVEVVIINESRWYGDALVGGSADLDDSADLASYEALVFPRFQADCPSNVRCAQYEQLSVQFLDEDISPIPASGARTVWMSFWVPCESFGAPCNQLDGYAAARALSRRHWTLNLTSKFVHEGELRAQCRFGPVSFERIASAKWSSLQCEDRA